jgi:penicillin-binding protein 1A
VLAGMAELGWLGQDEAKRAMAEPLRVNMRPEPPRQYGYFVEEVRRGLIGRYGEKAVYGGGLTIRTSYTPGRQLLAEKAFRNGLLEYDRRHGWRGPIGHADIGGRTKDEQFEELLEEYTSTGFLVPAVVVSETDKTARVFVRAQGFAQIAWDGLSWARKEEGPAPKSVAEIMAPGDVVYVVTDGKGTAQLGQVPDAQSALVSLNPNDGSIVALVGGFDYFTNKYNRVTQARRQPGSGFKHFVYWGAL